MQHPQMAPAAAPDADVAATRADGAYAPAPPRVVPPHDAPANPRSKWESRHGVERHRAETERLRVLVDFLARPIHSHGGADPDPDIVVAYNLAVEAALQGIRRAACSS